MGRASIITVSTSEIVCSWKCYQFECGKQSVIDMPINMLSGTVVKEIIDRRYPSDYRSVEGPILTWNELSKYKLAYNGGMLDVR